MLNYLKDYKICIHISYHILDFVQLKKTKFTMAQPYMLPSSTVNTMSADALATSGARASTDMVLIK